MSKVINKVEAVTIDLKEIGQISQALDPILERHDQSYFQDLLDDGAYECLEMELSHYNEAVATLRMLEEKAKKLRDLAKSKENVSTVVSIKNIKHNDNRAHEDHYKNVPPIVGGE